MSRTLKIVLCSIAAIAVAAYGGLWLYAQRTAPLAVPLPDRAAAVADANRIVDLGPDPESWPVRLFVPASSLQDVANAVVGTRYRIPFGDMGPEGPEGFLVAEIEKLTFRPTDFLLRATVEIKVTYAPVSATPWWGGATIRFATEADILPVQGMQDDPEALYFRLVPTSFSPRVRWGPLNYAASEMLSQVVASQLLERLGRDLLIPLPPLTAAIDLEPGLVATQEAEFPVDGSYTITTRYAGPRLSGEISTDRLLIVSSGVWLLGGLSDAPDPSRRPDALPRPGRGEQDEQAALDALALATKARLAPFERQSDHAEAHLPIAPVLALAGAAAQPKAHGGSTAAGPAATASGEDHEVSAVITEAVGTLFETQLASNRIAGDIDLAISPASSDFASGTLTFAPPALQWEKGVGLKGRLDATARGSARLHGDLSSSRIGRTLGADLNVSGSTSASFPFTLGLRLVRTGPESAIFLVPEIGCTRMAIDLFPKDGAGPLFAAPWFTSKSTGLRFERNFGGVPGTLALLDSKPRYVAFPAGNPLARGVTYPSDGVAITTAPRSLVIGEKGIKVTVALSARPASEADQAGFASQREALLAVLRQQLSAKPCAAAPSFRLLT
jgi:hypothetical protein